MAWTRRFFDKFEWLHKPISPIEESFMLPLQVNTTIDLLSERLGVEFPLPSWKVIDGYLYFTDEYWKVIFQPGIFNLPSNLIREIKLSKNRWLNQVLPKYQSQVDKFSQTDLGNTTFESKLELLDKISKLEAWLFAESLSGGVICGLTEILLALTYPLFVKNSPRVEYRELLAGYPDLGLAMDAELWCIAQLKNAQVRTQKLKAWAEKYGYRVADKDLLYPVLGEKPELINSYVELFKASPNPKIRIKNSQSKRIAREQYVQSNFRNIPYLTKIFQKIIFTAQDYARIRNSRPFYYQGNRLMRQILLLIASEFGLSGPNDVFFLKHQELADLKSKNTLPQLQDLTAQRKLLYQHQLETGPKFKIEL